MRQRRQLAGFDVMSQDGWEQFERLVPALFEGSQNAHQDFLGFGPTFAAVAVTVFSQDHRRPDFPFGAVAVEGDVELIEKREQLVFVPLQAFDQPAGVVVLPAGVDDRLQPLADFRAARDGHSLRQAAVLLAQPDRAADEPLEFLPKDGPVLAGGLVLRRVLQFAQQMRQALLRSRTRKRAQPNP